MTTALNNYLQAPDCQKEIRKEKPTVLFVIDTLEIGGSELSLLENVMRFEQITPVVCHLYEGDTLKPEFNKNNIKVYSLNIAGRYRFPSAIKQLRAVIKIEKPSLMVAYLTRSEITARIASAMNKIPVIGTFVNDLYCKQYNMNLSWKARRVVKLFQFINKITSKICVGFVANSEAIKRANANHLQLPANKIFVINRGRNSAVIKSRQSSLQSPTSLRFINVSRLFAVKGHRKLILGFKKFLKNCPGATLDIAGDGPLFDELHQLIKEQNLQNNIFLLGSRSDLPAILCEYDCFIFSSVMEGFSGAIVEAMFARVPVLATDIPQNREAINHLRTGYLFKPDSEDEIEAALNWFKENRGIAQALSVNAGEYAKNNFEQAAIAKKFESYLLQMISKQ
ncbi:MAG TPA: glycosyltransferase [Chitinophagaceae bacterium]|nr:glycosyltransferase [Chitinophagaceae bacterium]